MDEMERMQHDLHAKLPAFHRKLDWTRQLIADALGRMERPYIAFSGGNDSLCVLDLLSTAGHHIPVHFGDEGWDFPETIAFLHACEARYGFTLHLVRDLNAWRVSCQEMGRPDLAETPDAPGVWGNPFTTWEFAWDRRRPHLYPHMTHDGCFLGLLAAESRARRIVLRGGTRPLYRATTAEGRPIRTPDGREHEWRCSPLAAWTKRDVNAYLVSRGIPYNPIYDRLAALGVPLERRRIAALSYFGVARLGSHAVIKHLAPDLYNRLAALFPAIREYS